MPVYVGALTNCRGSELSRLREAGPIRAARTDFDQRLAAFGGSVGGESVENADWGAVDRRNASRLRSELIQISGVGEKTAGKLLQHFGSLERVRQASEDDLAGVVGRAGARKVRDGLADPSSPGAGSAPHP